MPGLSVLDNVFLGHETSRGGVLRRGRSRAHYEALAERIGLTISPEVPVGPLRTAQKQQIEIVRALARDARLIVMDEPTAALSRPDAERLHEVCRGLCSDGVTIVYVSHLLAEVLDLCDSVTVLKDGRLVKSVEASSETVDSLITSMLGRQLEQQFPEPAPTEPAAKTVLAVRDLSRSPAFERVSLEVRAGEIVGLAGLVGSGRSEIARAIFGADRSTGHIEVAGKRFDRWGPALCIRQGLAYLPESRKDEGLVMMRSVRENVVMAHLADVVKAGFVRSRHERRVVGDVLASVDTRAASISAPVAELSGGNQQKVALAKWLFRKPRVLLADEPTRGVDVGAKRAIYELICELAAGGAGILLISSELEELLGLAHRILVVRVGQIVAEFSRSEASEESIMRAAFGAGPDSEGPHG